MGQNGPPADCGVAFRGAKVAARRSSRLQGNRVRRVRLRLFPSGRLMSDLLLGDDAKREPMASSTFTMVEKRGLPSLLSER